MKLLLVPALLSMPCFADAQWVCREASSVRNGSTVTACGVGQSSNLDQARAKSREGAIEEFKRICALSSDCKEFDYDVVPKRTDCEIKNGMNICYRALDFIISDRKRKSVSVDLSDLESELAKKNAEIQSLQERANKIRQLKESEDQEDRKRKELTDLEASLNQKESEMLKLQDLDSPDTISANEYRYLHQAYKNSLKISAFYWASKLTSNSENDFLWTVAYERRPVSWLGLQVYCGFGTGHLDDQKSSQDDVPAQGPSNTTQAFNGPVSYVDVGISTIAYLGWRGTYLKADLGGVEGHKDSYSVSYNGAGVGVPQSTSSSFSSGYYGGAIGFDTKDDKKGWGVFFEIGARKVENQNSPGLIGGLGLHFGF